MENILSNFTNTAWLWQTFSAILFISIIDLVLSGDNAAVIGLAIRSLPKKTQKKAAMIGAGGAIILRITFTIFAVYLLQIKYLSAIGGVVLLWITYKLIASDGEEEAHVKSDKEFWSAVCTIIVADLSMAFDNVMGVAGAAHGEPWLVIFGLLLSIPILVLGATWVATLMGKYPIIIYIGAMVLMHTATGMIVHDQALNIGHFLGKTGEVFLPWLLAIPVLVYGFYITKKNNHHFINR